MKRFLLAFSLLAALGLSARASAVINLFDGQLLNANGITPMADGGLMLIEASTIDNTFAAPTSTSLTGGSSDDIIVASWGLSKASAGGTAGDDLHAVTLTYSGNFNSGDLLRLLWFPTLTYNSATNYSTFAPGVGIAFGFFRTDSLADGSTISWAAPADGRTDSLNFATVSQNGSQPNNAGVADKTTAAAVVPEPWSVSLLAMGGAALSVFGRRRKATK
jgi:hypothetical protein